MNYGFIRVSIAVPKLFLTNVDKNYLEHKKIVEKLSKTHTQVISFPELSLTGYSCGDLFHQAKLQNKAKNSFIKFQEVSEKFPNIFIVLGTPFAYNGALFNCAAVYNNGKLVALIPKSHLPNYNEFKERIYFQSAPEITKKISISGIEHKVIFGKHVVFTSEQDEKFSIGIEICEDLWGVEPPSGKLALNGANIILNLSASNELVVKTDYRIRLVRQQSERSICVYSYVSSGLGESTMDMVFGGSGMIYEYGNNLGEMKPFSLDNQTLTVDCDVDRINQERIRNTIWGENTILNNIQHEKYFFKTKNIDFNSNTLKRNIDPLPFLPHIKNSDQLNERCNEIMSIQANGLAMRFQRSKVKNLIIGLSGGLDSTYALLVCLEMCKILSITTNCIQALTLPGHGTSELTKSNTENLCKALKVDLEEISIVEITNMHLNQLGHSGDHDITFENAQARERTQILFDKANLINGLVIGTSDLSELALGWTTYNGDHMSSYGVNATIPKTLIRFLIQWYKENKLASKKAKGILQKIIDTPISPELIPPDTESGEIKQETESLIGPFELHDFFLFHFIRRKARPGKILFLAGRAFSKKYEKEEIEKWLRVFIERFFANQFKRSALPDGPKVGSVSLSPRGEWRIPSDIDDPSLWLDDIN
ncbi:MAG: Glutamine-dependent NAD(+) synthetase [Candidatus Heimdallarchaeota archaeon LC_3]|nr:MAG: Glutamine-dependent NAD(+) synthetase [Candidatus Heimdallarchaeota archaeon LC_3]